MRSILAGLVFVAGCGPSAGRGEECTPEDVVTSGTLVMGLDPEECSPCDLETSYVLITLETACEAGVEWVGDFRLVDHVTAVNLATGEHFEYEDELGQPAGRPWRVAPDEPLEWPGPRVNGIVTEAGDYSFRIDLLYDLVVTEFESSVE